MSDCRVIDDPGHYTLENDITTSDSGACIDITSDGVYFDGNGHVIAASGSSPTTGVLARSAQDVTVTDVTVRYFGTGVRFGGVVSGEISNVVVEPETGSNKPPGAREYGIVLDGGANNNLIQNNIVDEPGAYPTPPDLGDGIFVQNSHDNEIVGNEIYRPADVGIQLEGAQRSILTSNKIWADPWTYTTARTGIRLDADSNEAVLQGNYVYGRSDPNTQALQEGIYVASDRNTLTGNYVGSAYYSGIVVYGDDNELDSNTASGNVEHGFEIRSADIVLTNSIATGNGLSGLYLDGTTFGTVLNNTAYGNSGWDVELIDTAGLDAENTALSSGGPGVTLKDTSASIKGVGAEPVPSGMDHVDQFVEVEGSPTLEISYTDAAAARVDEGNLSLWYYDDSSWSHSGGSVDTVANVVSGSVASGVYAPLSTDALAPDISNFEATSPDDGELRVSFDSTEPLDALEVSVANETGTVETLTLGDFTESGYNSLTYTADHSIAPGSYNVTLASATDEAGNDGSNGHTDEVFVTGPLEVAAVEAIDERGTGAVNDGDSVEVRATVVGYGIKSVTADASVLGAGSVNLTDSNGDGVYNGTFVVDAYTLSDGRKSIDVTAVDGSGKTASNDSAELDLDTSNPTIRSSDTIDLEDGDGTVGHGDKVKVVVELSDFSGLETVVAYPNDLGAKPITLEEIDEGFYDTFEGTFTVDAANASYDGTKRISVQAADQAGNSVWFTMPSIYLDTSDVDPPTLVGATATNLDGPNDSVGDGDRIAVSVNATDELGVDAVTADASDFGVDDVTLTDNDGDDVYEATFVVDAANASADGAYGIDVEAVNVRNKRSTATTNALTLDTPRDLTAPVIANVTVSDPFDDWVVTDGDDVTVRATVTDEKSGVSVVQLDASAFGAGTIELENETGGDVYEGTFTVDAASAEPDGYRSLTIDAEDGDGNAATERITLELDRSIASDVTPPTINEFDVAVGSGDSILVTVNASERLTALDVTVRNESGSVVSRLTDIGVDFDHGSYGDSYRYFGNYPDPADGTYEVTLESAVDLAGNEGANGESGTVTIDWTDDGGDGTGDDVENDTLTVTGQLTESDGTTPASGDWVLLVDEETLQPAGDAITDGTGAFSLTVPDDSSYWVVYVQTDESDELGPVDGSPDIYTLASVDGNATITRTLPAAYETTVTVVSGDTGAPVPNATVSLAHGNESLLGLFSGPTDDQGRLNVGTDSQPDHALEVEGTLYLRVEPPSGSGLEQNATTLSVTGSTDAVVVLEVGDDAGDPRPDVTVVPPALDFGTQTVGGDELRTVTVENEGDATLSVTDVGLTGATGHFDVVGPTSFTLAPGGSRDVTVAFEPTSSGTKTATLEIHSDDPDEPTVSVALSGNGFSPSPSPGPINPPNPGPITPPNEAPVAVDDTYTAVTGETLTVDAPGLLENDDDPDGDDVTVETTGAAQNGTLTVDADGSFTYAPDEGFVGTETVSYEIEDEHGERSEPATVTIEVLSEPNRVPIAVADHFVTTEGETLSVSGPGPLANDYDPDGDDLLMAVMGSADNGSTSGWTSGTFEYTPDEGFVGTDSFVYRAADEHGERSEYGTITVEVLPGPNRAPVAVDDSYTIREGETLSVSGPGPLANDYDPDNDSLIMAVMGSADNGSTSGWTSGTFEYTPDEGFVGTDSFVYRAADEHGERSEYGTITVEVLPDPNRAPVAVDDHYTIREGETLSVSGPGPLANDYDPDNDSLILAVIGSADNGSTSGWTSGTFEYTPDDSFVGTDSFVYRAADEHGERSEYGTVTVEVVPDPNRAPVAVDDTYTVLAGETLSISGPGPLANDYDPDNDSLILAVMGSADNGSTSGWTSGTFEYTPDPGFVGTNSFVYRAADEHGERSEYGTITVEVVDGTGTEPIAADDYYAILEGETLSVSGPGPLANDYDPNGDDLLMAVMGSADNGSTSGWTSGTFEYTPDPGFVGTDSFVYRVADEHGERSEHGTITVEVLPDPNRQPVAVDDTYSVVAGETLSISGPGPLANDYDPDNDSLILAVMGSADNGSTSGWTSGTFEYTPDEGFVGTDSFVYRAADEHGERSEYGTITVEVLPDPNRAPIAIDDSYTILEGETLSVSGPGPLANDYDPDNDSLILAVLGDGDDGSTSGWTSGTFEYTPDPGFVGTDSFVYRAADEDGERSEYGTITVEVVPDPSRAPSTAPNDYVVGVDETLSVDAAGILRYDRDLDDDSFVVAVTDQVRHGTLNANANGSFTYAPDAGFTGVDSFTYVAEDALGERAPAQRVTIAVVNVTRPATVGVDVGPVDFGTVEVGTTATATIPVTNVGGSTLTVTGADLASGTGPFTVVDGDETVSLEAGETHRVAVAFDPTATGSATDTLRVHSDDSATPTVDVSLTGSGVESDDEDAGGTVTIADTGGVSTVSVSDATAGVPSRIDLHHDLTENVSLTGLKVTTNTDRGYNLTIESADDRPSEANFTAGAGLTAISYISIGHDVPDSEIDDVTFVFEVKKDRLTELGLEPDRVILYRNVGDQLVPLPTAQIGQTGDAYVFEAESPGLSVFVVGSTDGTSDDDLDGENGEESDSRDDTSDDGEGSDVGDDGEENDVNDEGTGGDDQSSESDDETTTGDDGLSGFGPVTAVVAIFAGILARGRVRTVRR